MPDHIDFTIHFRISDLGDKAKFLRQVQCQGEKAWNKRHQKRSGRPPSDRQLVFEAIDRGREELEKRGKIDVSGTKAKTPETQYYALAIIGKPVRPDGTSMHPTTIRDGARLYSIGEQPGGSITKKDRDFMQKHDPRGLTIVRTNKKLRTLEKRHKRKFDVIVRKGSTADRRMSVKKLIAACQAYN